MIDNKNAGVRRSALTVKGCTGEEMASLGLRPHKTKILSWVVNGTILGIIP